MSAVTALMYASGMADDPDLPTEMPIFRARDRLAKIIERARYFDTSTFLLNRGDRVAAIVSADLAAAADAVGGQARAVEVLRAHLEAQG